MENEECEECTNGLIEETCTNCSGSGEGFFDGSTCNVCYGKGSIVVPCDCPKGIAHGV